MTSPTPAFAFTRYFLARREWTLLDGRVPAADPPDDPKEACTRFEHPSLHSS
jgi:hypothetical protein